MIKRRITGITSRITSILLVRFECLEAIFLRVFQHVIPLIDSDCALYPHLPESSKQRAKGLRQLIAQSQRSLGCPTLLIAFSHRYEKSYELVGGYDSLA